MKMARVTTVVVVGASEHEAATLRAQAGGLIEVLAAEADLQRGLDAVQVRTPALALVYLDGNPEMALEVTRTIARDGRTAPILISRERASTRILQAMRAGAKDYAFLDSELADVRRALQDYNVSRQPEKPGAAPLASVVVVFGSKGGAGCTTIATNLAAALIPNGKATHELVALLDLDLQMGDVTTFLDVASLFTWRDLLRDLVRLDEDLLRHSLTVHRSGVYVVAQSDVIEDADDLEPSGITTAIGFLRRHHDFVVVDGVRDFSELSLSVMDMADEVLLITTQDVPAMKNAARCLSVFRRLGYGPEKIKLVVNRYQRRGEISEDAIADALGVPVDATVANDYATALRAINVGTMVLEAAPKSPLTADLRALAELVRRDAKTYHARRAP